MSDTSALATEEHELRPLSLYAETKVAVERELLGHGVRPMAGTVLRFATLFGVSPRMRFDLTVNQFVMEMLVHGGWSSTASGSGGPTCTFAMRPARSRPCCDAPLDVVSRARCSTSGHTDENYRKMDLVEIIGRRVPGAEVEFVSVADDPRDYKVSFERIRSTLDFSARHAVARRRRWRSPAWSNPVCSAALTTRSFSNSATSPYRPTVGAGAHGGLTCVP